MIEVDWQQEATPEDLLADDYAAKEEVLLSVPEVIDKVVRETISFVKLFEPASFREVILSDNRIIQIVIHEVRQEFLAFILDQNPEYQTESLLYCILTRL